MDYDEIFTVPLGINGLIFFAHPMVLDVIHMILKHINIRLFCFIMQTPNDQVVDLYLKWQFDVFVYLDRTEEGIVTIQFRLK